MTRLLSLVFTVAFAVAAAAVETSGRARLDRTNLLLYRNSDGDAVQGKSLRHWKKRRAEVLAGMQEVMGPLPGKAKRCPLEVRIEEETDCGTYVRRLVSYSAEPGSRVPAYLLIPKEALAAKTRRPAVIALHPTEMKIGHQVVVGLGTRENRAYAQELAERGYVVIAPAYPHMANYWPDLKALGYESGTMKAIWDNMRAIDLLESLPYVKRSGVGAIGHSLGGHNAVYTAVFDERIAAVVSSCGFDSYLDYMDGNIKGWTQERYMPKLANYAARLSDIPFDFHELIGALAPRAVLVNAPIADSNFKWQSVDRIAEAARPVFKLYGKENHLQVFHPDCAHDFPPEMRSRAYELFDRVLK